jgi:hypothetical protein
MKHLSIASVLLTSVVAATALADEPKRVMPVPGEGMQVREWASHPLVHDPVAIDIDPQGRVYVAKTMASLTIAQVGFGCTKTSRLAQQPIALPTSKSTLKCATMA